MKNPFTGFTRSTTCRRNILAGLAGLMLGSLCGYTLILWTNRYPPVVVREERELDGVAPRTGHIDIYIELDRMRDCPAETSRWLWTWVDHAGQRVKQFYPLANSPTSLSNTGRDQHFILSLPLPAGIWPGDWFYWSKTVEHCSLVPSLFRSPVRESADIPVRITDAHPDHGHPRGCNLRQ